MMRSSTANFNENKGRDSVVQSPTFTSDDKSASPAGRQDVEQEPIAEQVEGGLTLLSAVGAYRHTGTRSELVPPAGPVMRKKSKDEDEDKAGIKQNKNNEMSNQFVKESSQSSIVYNTGSRKRSGSWNSSNCSPQGSPNRIVPPANAFNRHHEVIGSNRGSDRDSVVHFSEGVHRDETSNIRSPPMIPRALGSRKSALLAFEVTRNELDAETDLMRSLDETSPLRRSSGTCDAVLSEVPIDTNYEPVHDFIMPDDDEIVGSIRTSHRKETSGGEGRSIERTRSVDSNTVLGRTSIASKRKISPTRVREGGHHRHLTVEENLFGMNAALSFFKMEDNKKRQRDEKQFAEQHTDQISKARAGDVFDAASVVFDRITKTSDSSSIQPSNVKPNKSIRLPNPVLDRRSSTEKPSHDRVIPSSTLDLTKTDGHRTSLSVKQDAGDIEGGSLEFSNYDDPRFDEAGGDGGPGQEDAFGWKDEKHNKFGRYPFAKKIKAEWETVNAFWKPRRNVVYTYLKIVVLYIMVPSLGIAGILFYVVDNPPTGTCPWEGCDPRNQFASASWWVLFLGCRQMVIITLAFSMEFLLVDYLALRTTACVRLFGPMFTLLLVQWKGWSMLVFFTGLFNFCLTSGDSNFANHWLYWQKFLPMMNRSNPSGYVTSSSTYSTMFELAMGVGAAVGVKRLMVGLHFGRRNYANYSKKLSSVMNKMLIMNELSRSARNVAEKFASRQQMTTDMLEELFDSTESEDGLERNSPGRSGRDHSGDEKSQRIIDPDDIDPYTGRLNREQRQRITELLGDWEEPPRTYTFEDPVASVSAVMQFRRGLAHMDTDQPFGAAFGIADTREACVLCSQYLYENLLLLDATSGDDLHFNAIAAVAIDPWSHQLDQEKAKDLIRIFRPERNGAISLIDFVSSVDSVYKELRLLRATIAANTKIDRGVEAIINGALNVVLFFIVIAFFYIDPWELAASLTGIVLAFAFMIGSATSKYFEGLMFILVQQPYEIGDRISIANAENPSEISGAQGWIVEDVTMFTTTLCLAATNERATLSNGTIASSRIINCARSPNAILYVTMRFAFDTPYTKVKRFRSAVESFVRNRPREWSSMLSFRVALIEANQGYIEYRGALRHRESWQNMVAVLNSSNTIHAFCLEMAKELDMRYISPALPVDLTLSGNKFPSQFEMTWDKTTGKGTLDFGGQTPERTHEAGKPSFDSEGFSGVAALFDADR